MKIRSSYQICCLLIISTLLSMCTNENAENITTGKRVKHKENGEYIEYEVVNGVSQGESKLFDKDGHLKRLSYFENNKRVGLCKEFYPNGNLKEEYKFWEEKVYGPYKTYNESGNLYETSTYIDGEINGTYIRYYPSGKIQYYSLFFNSNEKIRTEFDESGNPTYEQLEYVKINYPDTINAGTDLYVEFKMINGRNNHRGAKDFVFKYGELFNDGSMEELHETYKAIGDSVIKINIKPSKNKGYNVFTGLIEYQSVFGDTSNLVSVPYKGLYYIK